MALTEKQIREEVLNKESYSDEISEKASKRLRAILDDNSIYYIDISSSEILKSFYPMTGLDIYRVFFKSKEGMLGNIDIFLDCQKSLKPGDSKEEYFMIDSHQAKMISARHSISNISTVYASYIYEKDEIYFKPAAFLKCYISKIEKARKQIWMRVEPKDNGEEKRLDDKVDGLYTHHSLGFTMLHKDRYIIREQELMSTLSEIQNFDQSWKLKNKVFFNILQR